MTLRIGYTRRVLPQESKQVPPPRLGKHPEPQLLAPKKALPSHGSDPLPLLTAVIPATRIATPR